MKHFLEFINRPSLDIGLIPGLISHEPTVSVLILINVNFRFVSLREYHIPKINTLQRSIAGRVKLAQAIDPQSHTAVSSLASSKRCGLIMP